MCVVWGIVGRGVGNGKRGVKGGEGEGVDEYLRPQWTQYCAPTLPQWVKKREGKKVERERMVGQGRRCEEKEGK